MTFDATLESVVPFVADLSVAEQCLDTDLGVVTQVGPTEEQIGAMVSAVLAELDATEVRY